MFERGSKHVLYQQINNLRWLTKLAQQIVILLSNVDYSGYIREMKIISVLKCFYTCPASIGTINLWNDLGLKVKAQFCESLYELSILRSYCEIFCPTLPPKYYLSLAHFNNLLSTAITIISTLFNPVESTCY